MIGILRRAVRRYRRFKWRRAERRAHSLFRERHSVGQHTYGTPSVGDWGEGARLVVGSFCSIGGGVQILLGGNHRPDWVTTFPFNKRWEAASGYEGTPVSKGDVRIGNDVWIGNGTLILSGVAIGDGAVVAAHAVVTRDVLPYEIVAGNPAKHVRFRFDEETIAALEEIAWWTWEDSRLLEAMPLLLSDNVKAFAEQYRPVPARAAGNEAK